MDEGMRVNPGFLGPGISPGCLQRVSVQAPTRVANILSPAPAPRRGWEPAWLQEVVSVCCLRGTGITPPGDVPGLQMAVAKCHPLPGGLAAPDLSDVRGDQADPPLTPAR